MTENDLTKNLQGLLAVIEKLVADEIEDNGSFDPYGIVVKRGEPTWQLIHLEAMADSDSVLKGNATEQIKRRIEDMIRNYRNDPLVESAALVTDARLRGMEGGDESEAVVVWLADRGRQYVRVIIDYEVVGGSFRAKPKTIESRDALFLPPLGT